MYSKVNFNRKALVDKHFRITQNDMFTLETIITPYEDKHIRITQNDMSTPETDRQTHQNYIE